MMPMPASSTVSPVRRVLLTAALLLTLVASGSHASTSIAETGTSNDSRIVGAAPDEPPSKLLVFVVENHSLRQMRAQMPFTRRLGNRYGHATGYRAITHPSLPNYLAITTGSTHGIRDDKPPAAHPLPGTSVFGQALRGGRTATVYAESMTKACLTVNRGRYAVRHNPWAYQHGERAACRRHDVPLRRMKADVRRGRLPTVGMVVPNLCHDAHDCPLRSADRWLRRQMTVLRAGDDWKLGRLVVVITADEDAHDQDNRVLTVVAHPSVHRAVSHRSLSHYSLSRAYSQMAGAAPLRHARHAASLLGAFGLSAPPQHRAAPRQHGSGARPVGADRVVGPTPQRDGAGRRRNAS